LRGFGLVDTYGTFQLNGTLDFNTMEIKLKKVYQQLDAKWSYNGILDCWGIGGFWGSLEWGGTINTLSLVGD